jgi:phage shock protein A
MINFLKKLLVRVFGWLHVAGDDLVTSSPDSIKSTYTLAIKEAGENYNEMQRGLAMMMQQQQRIKNMMDSLDKSETDTEAKLRGAVEMAQSDPDNPIHKVAGSKYLVRLDEVKKKKEQQINDLGSLTHMIEDYKLKLGTMRVQIDDLKREQAEMTVEFIAAQNNLRLEEKLQGISTTSAVDESIIAIREKVENMKAQVQVAAEMRGTSQKDDVYAEIGAEKQAAARFDELLKARQTKVLEPQLKERDLG